MDDLIKNNNSRSKYDLDLRLKTLAKVEVNVPEYLSSQTAQAIYEKLEKKEQNLLPYVLGSVFFSNILISLIIGGILYMMRPFTLLDWLIVGLIYSAINVFLYGPIIAFRKKIYALLNSFS